MHNLNHKKFVTAHNDSGLSSDKTIFYYKENENGIITATYEGGPILQGSILGKRVENSNKIELIYHCITSEGELKAGESKGTITQDKNGKLVLNLNWKWLNGNLVEGISKYTELD